MPVDTPTHTDSRLSTVCLGAVVLYLSGMLLLSQSRHCLNNSNSGAVDTHTHRKRDTHISARSSPAVSLAHRKTAQGHVDTGSALDANAFTDHPFPATALPDDEDSEKIVTEFATHAPVGASSAKLVAPIVEKIAMSTFSKDVIVIGIAGGSGSGKTTLANAIYKAIGKENICFISHDSYYKDLSHLPIEEREKNNFDHPDSLDTALLIEHIQALKRKESVLIPTYDFSTHSRGAKTEKLEPRPVVLVEGILIFADPKLYSQLDIRMFVDTDDDIRFIRRVSRDTKERGRTLQGVIDQYISTVRPMHLQFVEPSKRNADIIVPVGLNSVALDLVVSRLRDHLVQGAEGERSTTTISTDIPDEL